MIKHSIIIISLIAFLVIIGGHAARGYWAAGPELIVIPILSLVAYVVYQDSKKGV